MIFQGKRKLSKKNQCFRDVFAHGLLILKLDISWHKRCSLHHGWSFPDSVCTPTPPATTKDFCHHQEFKWYCSWQEHEQWLGIVLDLKESRDEERVLDLKESQRCKENTGSQRKTKREYWISNKAEDGEVDSFMWKTHPPGHTQYDYELWALHRKKGRKKIKAASCLWKITQLVTYLGYIYKKRLYIYIYNDSGEFSHPFQFFHLHQPIFCVSFPYSCVQLHQAIFQLSLSSKLLAFPPKTTTTTLPSSKQIPWLPGR